MNREKQIEEMAKVIARRSADFRNPNIAFMTTAKKTATAIYHEFFCKQSEETVEVVRCKDCKYYEIHKPNITLNCEREGKLIPMMPNDFCSYGEPKMKGGEGYARDFV